MQTLTEALTTIEELKASVKTISDYVAEAKKKAEAAEDGPPGENEIDKKRENLQERTRDEQTTKKAEAKFHKAMKAAMEEEDETKKADLMKSAMKLYKSTNHFKGPQKGAEVDDDKDVKKENDKDPEREAELTAELTILRKEASKPRLQFLEASYKGRVDEKTLKEYKAQWNEMNLQQLDAAIETVKPFVASKSVKQNISTATPAGFSTLQIPTSFSASSKEDDEFTASLEKQSLSEVFT